MNITHTTELCQRFNSGEAFEFLHFWGHHPRPDGRASNSCFSQWFESPFKLEDINYPTAEHFMMSEKAVLFGDAATRKLILKAPNPGAAKALGRQVKGYTEEAWVARRFEAVVQGNRAKFSQNPTLATYLVATGTQVLVEASPVDPVWGIGLATDDPRANNPNTWQGLNLLGFALMVVRSELQSTTT
jgi:ribA/ribD-fused uncharacterized protein